MTFPSNAPPCKHFLVTWPAEHIVHIEINRPQKLNAFYEPMWLELRQIFNHFSTCPDTRAIILSGAGPKAFTAGLDVQHASESGPLADSSGGLPLDGARAAIRYRRHILDFQDCISAVEQCEKPVICALHGFTMGLGIDLSTSADVRICSDDTKFAVKEVDIGLAADIGTLSRLPKVTGNFSWVKDICLSARIFLADEALQFGLVSGVYEGKEKTIEAALRWATLVAEKSPVAVQGTKELLNFSRNHSIEDGLRYTAIWNSAALQTRDVPIAMKAGMAKRKPTFEKL